MTPFKRFCSASRSKYVTFSSIIALSPFSVRHILPYIRGIISFTRLSPSLLCDEA
jgi:hypothetical protein